MRPCYLRTQPRANEPQNRTFCAHWLCRTPYRQAAHTRRSARVSGYRAGRYLLSVTAPVQLERCHPADPGRRAREAAADAHKLTVSADFNAGDPPRDGFAARAVLHDSPGHELRAPGTGDTRAEWVTRNCRQRRLGTKWESPALAVAPEGSLPLTCAWLHLREHGDDLVRKIRMHSWGSRGRGFKSRRPDNYCRSEATSPAR
jgi:hypothetical protein